MSKNAVHVQREKFDDFMVRLNNVRSTMEKTKWKAEKARHQPDTTSMSPTELAAASDMYDAGIEVTDRDAADAREACAAVCRGFRNWCTHKRDIDIPRILNDAAHVFEDGEHVAWQELHNDIVKELGTLEAECPVADDPPPPGLIGTARRVM